MNIEIVPAWHWMAIELAPRLRQLDKDECMASAGFTPVEALTRAVLWSDLDMCWAALIDDVPEVMWGVAGCGDHVGSVWLLGSDIVPDIGKTFWKQSKTHVALMHTRYSVLTNWISVHNIPSLRWLTGLGFKPVEFAPLYGHLKQPFIRYESTHQRRRN